MAATVAALGHRAFVALAFDRRVAHTLGLRPGLAHAVLLGLVTLAIVASFHVVGTLLVFGLLIAPPAAAVDLRAFLERARRRGDADRPTVRERLRPDERHQILAITCLICV